MIFCIAMGNQRLRTGRIVLFSSVANDPTESTRDFGRISRVFPILYRVYNSIIYGIRFGAVSLEMDMTRPPIPAEFLNPASALTSTAPQQTPCQISTHQTPSRVSTSARIRNLVHLGKEVKFF